MRFFRTNFSRRTLVQNAGIVAGAEAFLGLGSSATVQSQSASPVAATVNLAPWRSLAIVITTLITFE